MKFKPSHATPARRERQPLHRRAAIASMLCAGFALAPAWASDKKDQDRARAAVQAGEIMPLPTVLERLQASHPGQVMELELEREDGRWVYEIKLLQADGQLLKLELDAATAEVLKVKQKNGGARQPQPAGTGAARP